MANADLYIELTSLKENAELIMLNEIPELENDVDIIQCWRKDDSDIYHNMNTGKQSTSLADTVRINKKFQILSTEEIIHLGYAVQYCPKLDGVILLFCSYPNFMDIICPQEGATFKLRIVDSILIKRDKSVYKQIDEAASVTPRKCFYLFPDINLRFPYVDVGMNRFSEGFDSPSEYHSNINMQAEMHSVMQKEFANIFPPICTAENSPGISWNGIDQLLNFLRTRELKKTNSDSQKIIDDLVQYPLPDHSNEFQYHPIVECRKMLIDKVPSHESMCVVRMYINYEEHFFETNRIYVDKNNFIACRNDNKGDWVYIDFKGNDSINWFYTLKDFNHNAIQGTKLAYFEDIMKDIDAPNRGVALWCLVKYPFTESLCKIGLSHYFNKCCMGVLNPVQKMCKHLRISPVMLYSDSLYKIIGFNKHQLNTIKDVLNDDHFNFRNLGRISQTKTLLSDEGWNIANIDDETFDKVWRFLALLSDTILNASENCNVNNTLTLSLYDLKIFETSQQISNFWGVQTFVNTIPIFEEFINRIVFRADEIAVSREDQTLLVMYNDYIKGAVSLGDKVHFKPYVRSVDEETITLMHDNMSALVLAHQDECFFENWDKNSKRWDKWVFEDEQYTVIAPSSAKDLAVEGIALHHCVKNYIPKIANGETNIMFIRKKEDINIPFFTVEITSMPSFNILNLDDSSNKEDYVIFQVHGLMNCNADTIPGLNDFISKWAKEKNLKIIGNYDIIR